MEKPKTEIKRKKDTWVQGLVCRVEYSFKYLVYILESSLKLLAILVDFLLFVFFGLRSRNTEICRYNSIHT